MRKHWNKALGAGLALTMCLSLLPTAAFAAEPELATKEAAFEPVTELTKALPTETPGTPAGSTEELEEPPTAETTKSPMKPESATKGDCGQEVKSVKHPDHADREDVIQVTVTGAVKKPGAEAPGSKAQDADPTYKVGYRINLPQGTKTLKVYRGDTLQALEGMTDPTQTETIAGPKSQEYWDDVYPLTSLTELATLKNPCWVAYEPLGEAGPQGDTKAAPQADTPLAAKTYYEIKWNVTAPEMQTPTVNNDGGKVSVSIDGEYKGNGNASFDLKPQSNPETVTEVTANFDKYTTQTIAAKGGMTITSPVADVTLDQTALQAVNTAADEGKNKITVELKKVTDAGGSKAAVEVNVTAGNKNLLPEGQANNGNVTISIPVTNDGNKPLYVYYVMDAADASTYVCVNEVPSNYSDGKVTFTTNHLSKYVVTDKKQATAEASYTAADDSTKYDTLANALKNAKDNSTVTLRNNVAVAGSAAPAAPTEPKAAPAAGNTGYTVEQGKTLTLELNGHTITQTVTEKKASALFTNNGTLTIQDNGATKGGLVANIGNNADGEWKYGNYVIDNHGTITLNCNISNTLDQTKGAAIALNNASGGKMTINGGTIKSDSTAIRVYAQSDTASTDLTINGGTIISCDPVWVQADKVTKPLAKVTVTGGEIQSNGKGSNGPTTIRTNHMGQTGLDGITIAVSGGKLTGGNIDLGAPWADEKTETGEKLNITGGEIDGILVHKNGSTAKHEGEVTGGIFKTAPEGMIKNDASVACVTDADGMVTAVGEKSIQESVKKPGVTEINVTQGNVTLKKEDVPAGAVVKNSGDGIVKVGDQTINKDESISPNPKPDSGSSHHSGGSSSYSISAGSMEHGTVTISPTRASKGDTVTITTSPDKGYAVDSVTATDNRGKSLSVARKDDNTFTFTMPSSKVDVKAIFRPEQQSWVNPFYDVSTGAYYYDAVAWAAQKGITGGTSATAFSPDAACTRAQIVTFLWRAAGSPAPRNTANPFADVRADSYYSTAVLWAVENGITSGTSATAFSPDATCTRAQAVTFLYRSEKSPAAGSSSSFGDVPANAYYAKAVAWAAQKGITGGTSATTFSPDAKCTRAQIVTFLYRGSAQ